LIKSVINIKPQVEGRGRASIKNPGLHETGCGQSW
jgi:hypothetical protein